MKLLSLSKTTQMIPRFQKDRLQSQIKSNKLLLVRGPGYVGKVTLIKEVLKEENLNFSIVNCKKDKKILDANKMNFQPEIDVVVFTEAQYFDGIQSVIENGLTGKIKQTIIISCSYTPQIDPDLLDALKQEGLDFMLYAPSFSESAQHFGLPKESELLEERLIFGNYPSVLSDLENAEPILRELIQDVINTQLGSKDRVNKGDKLFRMLQLLAFEIGEPVSFNQLGESVGLDNETVERYIKLLVDAHLLITLPSYHTEQRYELKKAHCIYFLDNGLRNALISNFNSTLLRNDMDQLWKNYLISERIKWANMKGMNKSFYFWRTSTSQQMDFIEIGDTTFAYKADWQKRGKVKIPNSFIAHYPNVKTSILNRSTYWNFLTKKV